MKELSKIAFFVLLPSVFCSNLLRFKRQEQKPCVCVPYFQCGPDNIIDIHGTFQIDPRIDPADPNPTCSGVDICCGLPTGITSTEVSPPDPDNGESRKPIEPPINTGDGSSILVPQRPPGVTGCGVKRLNPLDPRIDTDVRITGEKDIPESTYYGEFPWMIAVFKEIKGKKEFICGGSLIAPGVVLTAAHCIGKLEPNEVIVRAGDWDSRTAEEPFKHQDRRGKRISVHKDFDSGNLRNDIALIFVEHEFEIGEAVDTICIDKVDFKPETCFATGWGINSFNESGRYQPILKKVHLPIVPRDTCQAKLRETRLGQYFQLHKSFMCAGGVISEDTCAGDGGGPLVCNGGHPSQHKFSQVGIVSWGIGCGNEHPAVYSSIDYFYDWIMTQINYK